MKTQTGERGHFEDFIAGGGQFDIFHKIKELDSELKRAPHPCLDGLGVRLLGFVDHRVTVEEPDGQRHEVVMLGSNSYLSLTTHPAVVAASKTACDKYGYGMGAVSLYAGTTDLHRELEKLIAEFYETEDAVIFPCGYSANVGIISALCGPGDVVIKECRLRVSVMNSLTQPEMDTALRVFGELGRKHGVISAARPSGDVSRKPEHQESVVG